MPAVGGNRPLTSVLFWTHALACHFPQYLYQYSGGQATEGQGGFYGSGGARVIKSSEVDSEGRQALLAMAADVEKISAAMDELYQLELEKEDGVTTKSIEIKASM